MIQERIYSVYPAVQLPIVYQDEDRGFKKCCEKLLVLANGDGKTYHNDVNSAWIKLSSVSDSATFKLLDHHGNETTYTPTVNEFINEPYAFYTTIQWADVLASDGIGCYSISVDYSIGGIDGSFIWSEYELKPYTIENALGTARVRVLFNLNQTIEGINFTDSNVEDSIRFRGQIRKDQPNMEIDNLIYGNRKVETVVNENLHTYLLQTDPYTDNVLKLFYDLYLLSANEMFISDYNAHTSSYEINDIEAMTQESPERNQIDKFTRFESLSCMLSDRVKNKRAYY